MNLFDDMINNNTICENISIPDIITKETLMGNAWVVKPKTIKEAKIVIRKLENMGITWNDNHIPKYNNIILPYNALYISYYGHLMLCNISWILSSEAKSINLERFLNE